MKRFFLFSFLLLSFGALISPAQEGRRIMDVLDERAFSNNQLENISPQPYQEGFRKEGNVFVLENPQPMSRGVAFRVVLNQSEPLPICALAESRFEGKIDAKSPNYSVYLDIVYQDGSAEWGVAQPFAGTKDWEKKSVVFSPTQPIRSLTMYLLFRNQTGVAFFRNPCFYEARRDQNASANVFDDILVLPCVNAPNPTQSGFRFYVRDAAKNDAWYAFEPTREGKLAACGLALRLSEGEKGEKNDVQHLSLTLASETDEDRCVTFVCAIPLDVPATKCFLRLDGAEEIAPATRREYFYTSRTLAGMGRLARLPLIGAGDATNETFLGVNPDFPAVCRLFYNAGSKELCVSYDLGFAKEKKSAELKICRFAQQSGGGMRAAWETYMRIFPHAFEPNLPRDENGVMKMGVWMPFAKISEVPHFEDFGFRFKEGNDETAWDDAHDILTFRYTEPMTWWMPLSDEKIAEAQSVIEAGEREVERLAKGGNLRALAWKNSVMHTHEGTPAGRFLRTPWCDGVVWSMNSAPRVALPSDFASKWSPEYVQNAYDNPTGAKLDGEYVDSSEGYVTAELNYRREHFATTETPLTFDAEAKAPAIFRGLTTFEYSRKISTDVRARGKSMMANSTPHRLFWLVPLFDVLGTECNWKINGQWTPLSVEDLRYKRMLCGKKPYCFLQNTKFSQFSYEDSEKFMKRSLAFGMFPGYFSEDASTGHYFSNPDLFERDRPLFKKYIPICRQLAEAGWEPVVGAKIVGTQNSDAEGISLERFGCLSAQVCFLVVFNPTSETKVFRIQFDDTFRDELLARVCTTLLGNDSVEDEIRLEPEDVRVFVFQKKLGKSDKKD
ncbi:MAG: hypothetical protein Q4D38_14335 [Planctomycetia bacterium]|nr:hypothetical protein [Planctomycetia bacterium]